MANDTIRYSKYSGVNGVALLVQVAALVVGVVLGFGQVAGPEEALPVWYQVIAGVIGTLAFALLVTAVGTMMGRPNAVHVAGGWYLVLAACGAVFAIASFLIVDVMPQRVLLAGVGVLVALLAMLLLQVVTQQVGSANSQGARKLRYGGRVEVAVLLVLALVAMANYGAKQAFWRADVTRDSVHGLSPRSVQLVEQVDVPVRLTSLYAIVEDSAESEQLKAYRDRVQELLDEYQRVNPKIEVASINPRTEKDRVLALVGRLKDIYLPEAAAHIELIKTFRENDLSAIKDLLAAERALAVPLLKGREDRQVVDVVNQVLSACDAMTRRAENTERALDVVLTSDVPQYSQGTAAIREHCDEVTKLLDSAITAYREMSAKAGGDEGLTGFFSGGRERLGAVLARCREVTQQIDGLPTLDSESLAMDLQKPNPVIVETVNGVKVLSFQEVWSAMPGSSGRPGDVRWVFQGEQALSSAILALTQTDKSVVVFVRWGGPSVVGFRGPLSGMAKRLEDVNFEVLEWNIQEEQAPPVVESMSRAIWVLIPPQPPAPSDNMPFARPPTITAKEQQKIEHFLNSGGRAMFMMMPTSAMLGPPSRFVDMFKTYGIEVDQGIVAVYGPPGPDGQVRAMDNLFINAYGDHPIVKDLGAFGSLFVRAVKVEAVPSEGAESATLVRVPNDEDHWGETAHMSGSMGGSWTKDAEDLPGGFGIAAAGAKGDSKIVVVGDFLWSTDQVTMMRSGFLGMGGARFPGNSLLFESSLFWLNDNEQMIAVPAQAMLVPRLAAMSPELKWAWKFVAVVGLPLLCLVAGGVVWWFRRA